MLGGHPVRQGVRGVFALQVRTVPVETRQVALSDLRVPPPRREELRSVEASLRLDALASAGGWLACVWGGGGQGGKQGYS
jgi:hypothetical protein